MRNDYELSLGVDMLSLLVWAQRLLRVNLRKIFDLRALFEA